MRCTCAILAALIVSGPQYGDVPADPSETIDYRRPVKNLLDRGAHDVDPRPVRTSVRAMCSLRRPSKVVGNPRRDPVEMTTWTIRGRLLGAWHCPDGDIHLDIADPRNLKEWMVAEIPPLGKNPEHEIEWRAMRQDLECRGYTGRTPHVMVTVEGVGFFDCPHSGAANGIELHPVLALTFEARS